MNQISVHQTAARHLLVQAAAVAPDLALHRVQHRAVLVALLQVLVPEVENAVEVKVQRLPGDMRTRIKKGNEIIKIEMEERIKIGIATETVTEIANAIVNENANERRRRRKRRVPILYLTNQNQNHVRRLVPGKDLLFKSV